MPKLSPQVSGTQHRCSIKAVFVVLLLAGLLFYGLGQRYMWKQQLAIMSSPLDENAVVTSTTTPKTLKIPKLKLTVPFTEPLGLTERNEIEVPEIYDAVGWYKYSPSVGQIGPMVVLGHVDSVDGPAVFYSLGQLVAGDEVIIVGSDETAYTYRVEQSEKYGQDIFPSEKVYGNTDYPALRLVTCSGTYDRVRRRYTHNRVVYARLVSTVPLTTDRP